ncbi:DUF3467 domain-containing protein [bacterium]|jgi:hypothetical protein|nr:DUF3467 domain-containing protein [bacterium]MBT4251125.1 DUF3467 domain-containing protein [bacterium]MBT4598083.1 DUF3467 domain-containing protein [bacterium]MBT6753425.1 DUF3467 domain-containing protein [bacterium]MBT7038138.1 DUF3467 domain-containing protein [bacterium]
MNQNQQPQAGQQQIQIKANDEDLKGKYSNTVQMMHTKEEFVLDFLNIFPPTGTLNSRVIVSPSHFKRMTAAMSDNLKKYEEKFGKIKDVKGEESGKMGFVG